MTDKYSDWVGRTEHLSDTLELGRSNALRTTFGADASLQIGDELPLLYHWLYFWDVRPPQGLGLDGHPLRGGFLPPVQLPRRMWAGGRVKFLAPLRLGETVTKTSTILRVEEKSGKSGNLVFVTVSHELVGDSRLAIVEEQDIVYREAAAPGSIKLPSGEGQPDSNWRRDIMPDAVMLFRYSALTMNGHRIHYDRPYAMGKEAYPALVVQGPMQATLLADLAVSKLGRPLTGFDFRGQAPAFDHDILGICGIATDTGASLWSEQGGAKSMIAEAR